MSLVSEELWRSWMGEMPMPEDCTTDIMWAMYDAVKKVEDKEYASEQIAFYEKLWRKYLPEYNVANEHKDESLEAAQKFVVWDKIMRQLKDSIGLFRKELVE